MRFIVIPNNFPPEKGGIHTYMYSICHHLADDQVICFADETDNSASFDREQRFSVVRILDSGFSFLRLLRHVFQIAGILWKSRENEDVNSGENLRSKLITIFSTLSQINSIHFAYLINYLIAIMSEKDVIHSHLSVSGIVLPSGIISLYLKLIFNLPYIVFVHGNELLTWPKQKRYKKLVEKIYNNADVLIANSRFTANLLSQLDIDKQKIVVINPGVDINIFYPMSVRQDLIDCYQVRNRKTILTVSYLDPRKGHDVVIQSLSRIIKKVPDVLYLIAGEGPYKNQLLSLVRALGLDEHVRFLGSVDDDQVPLLMNICDLFIMPSRLAGNSIEGFGIVFLEANACGKPVIGAKSGGMEDAVVDGITGYLVEPLDEEKIAGLVVKLLNDRALSKKLGNNGLLRVKQDYNWPAITNLFRQIIIEKVKQ
ncbi:glycosyltransferase family 4 protein [bacterium]|nr:glycosyltransferase family 4 protein [bacterium]